MVGDSVSPLTHHRSGHVGVLTSYNRRYMAPVFNIRPNAYGTSYIGKRCVKRVDKNSIFMLK